MSGSSDLPVSIVFTDAARQEFAEAVAWYDEHQPGVGDQFIAEVKRAVQRIRDYPNAWARVSPRSRRCRLSHFPYGVIYQSLPQEMRIIAIAHLHRRPDYWQEREQP